MTATQLMDRLADLGVKVAVRDGTPRLESSLNVPLTKAVRAELGNLAPDLARHRDEVLSLCGVFTLPTALRQMEHADDVVDAMGAVGTHPEIHAAAVRVCEAFAAQDRAGVAEWCEQVERLARLNRRIP